MKHILHYNTHADKRYFIGKDRVSFDLIGLNGNIVSHSPSGVAALLATATKPFYIDPQTHAFQHPTMHLKREPSGKNHGKKEFKPSIVRLAKERLGEPFASVIDTDRPLSPEAFLDENEHIIESAIKNTCAKVVSFQVDFLLASIDEDTREFMPETDSLEPDFVIAPYFYLSEAAWEKWLQINLAFYLQTKATYSRKAVYFALLLPKILLAHSKTIIKKIKASIHSFDGILLWIDDHEEEALTSQDCDNYISFLKDLKTISSNILNAHGGYLSSLLCHQQTGPLLSGIGHSANYGEHRAIIPIGGGIPRARFYLFKAHSRLRFAEAAEIVVGAGWLKSKEVYNQKICRCVQCNTLIRKLGSAEAAFNAYGESNVSIVPSRSSVMRFEFPTSEAREAGIRHYLFNKAYELQKIASEPFENLLLEIERDTRELLATTDGGFVHHLSIWHDCLIREYLK